MYNNTPHPSYPTTSPVSLGSWTVAMVAGPSLAPH